MRDDSRNSVTSDERGERALLGAQRPAPSATSHFTRRPRTESPPAPRRPRGVAPAGPVPPGANRLTRTRIFLTRPAALALLAALLAAAPVAAQTDVWTATLTPADFGSGSLGCNNASAIATSKCSTATVLSDDDFTYDSTDYSVTTVFLTTTAFTLTVDADITAATNALTVVVGSTSLAFADANTQSTRTRTWFNPGFSWTAGTAVSIRIPDITPPSLTSATVSGSGGSIALAFSEDLQSANLPPAAAFDVTAGGTPVMVSAVAAGTTEDVLQITVSPLIAQGQAVVVAYADPTDGDDANAIQDTVGNDTPDFTTGSGGVPAVTNDSTVPNAVPDVWSLTPTGLTDGTKFRLLFLSSTTRDAVPTDIADYNTFVQDRAAAGHADIRAYSAGFRVVGCTAAVDARDNTATTYTISDKGVPIYWLDGTQVADDYEDFYDGSWDDEANDTNESGTDAHDTAVVNNYPYTGCKHDGTEAVNTHNNSEGLGANPQFVRVGRPNSSVGGTGPLSSLNSQGGNATGPMYGLSAVFQVVDITPPSLTRAVVLEGGNTIQLVFSEDLQSTNLPPAAAFDVTAGGTPVMVSAVAAGTTEDVLQITVSPLIAQGQAVVVAYADPTDGDDANAIQDTVGNDTPDFTTGSGGVPAVTNDSTIPNAVFTGWSLTPTGLAAGAKFRLLFLSSTKRDALSSDIADYNTFVQDRAAAGHADIRAYSAGFRVVGCTAAVDARDNTATTYTISDKGVPIYWLDGTQVADDYEDFYDGSWDDEVNDKNESGTDAHDTSQSDNYPITGCKNDGTEEFAGATRPRGLGATTGFVRTGRLNSSGTLQDPIDGNDVADTDATSPMYGLSAVFEVAGAANTPALGAPTITGTPTVGQTLTAVTSAIMDANGLNNVSYTYQWIRVATDTTETNIAMATANTYTLVTDDLGTTIKVKVSFTDDASNAETLTSVATAVVTADTTPPMLVSATVTSLGLGTIVEMDFDERLKRPSGGQFPAAVVSLITVTVDGVEVDLSARASTDGISVTLQLQAGAKIRSGQTVVIAYFDDTSGNDPLVFEDNAGNDVATFTTGMNGVPPVTNNSTVAPVAPGAPTGLTATANGSAQIDLSWTAPADNGGRVITGYKIEVSSDAGNAWTTHLADTTSADTHYEHTGLAASTTRDYRVSAINTIGTSPASNVDDATTGAGTNNTAVPNNWSLKPTGLAVGYQFRLLFLSSTKRNAQATDIAVYNTFIQTLAAAGHTDIRDYSAGFRVVGCTADTDARDNTSTNYTGTGTAKGVPIYWLGGAKAADKYADFYDGSWDDEANDKNESGTNSHDTSMALNYPWTGCGHDGTEAVVGSASFALGTSESIGSGVGRPNSSAAVNGPLGSDDNAVNTSTRPMYGLSAVFQVAPAVVNSLATGQPAITGTAQVGQTLTAVTTAIMDTDGLTTPGYTYQWIRVATDTTETNISMATASTYTLVTDDLGTTIKVKVSFTDDASNAETRTSVATAAVAAPDTTPPTLVSATVVPNGSIMRFQFSENLDGSNLPPVTAFTVTAGGNTITNNSTSRVPGSRDGFALSFSPPYIRQGQTVVITYTDPTGGNDANAIQDNAGNDVETFTTGVNSVPDVTNNSTVAPGRPRRPDRPHGHGQRDHPDRPLLDRPGRQRRPRHHRLQDRDLPQRHRHLDRPRRQHRQPQHHLRAHRPGRQHHPPLPRLGHQHHRHQHRLQHRRRHHGRRYKHRAHGLERRGDRHRGHGLPVHGGQFQFLRHRRGRRPVQREDHLPARIGHGHACGGRHGDRLGRPAEGGDQGRH